MSNHAHRHEHRFEANRRRLLLAFWSQAAFFVVELVTGIVFNSLALQADAGHMLSDVGALGLSLIALLWTIKPPTPEKTYGYHRLEILAALINGLTLWGISVYIFYEAYSRFFQPPLIRGLPLVVVGGLGLAVNLFGVLVLFPSRKESLNVRSAFLHLAADSLGSLATIIAGALIIWLGWHWFDPLAGGIIGVLIIIGSYQLVMEAANILLEATPKHIDLDLVQKALEAYPGVNRVHDLHVWTIASGIYALSVHVAMGQNHADRDCLIWDLEQLLHDQFGLEHVTIQTEGAGYHNPEICPLTRWGQQEGADPPADPAPYRNKSAV
jgi:cobalt-zinc-cadmium efflux system protein